MSSISRDLAALLGQIRRPGDFYATGTIDIHPPRLEVEGVGPIALPLLPVQAEEVIALARRCGACGWKVNGAGGMGGSLTILGPPDPEPRDRLRSALAGLGKGIRILPLRLSASGLTIRAAALMPLTD